MNDYPNSDEIKPYVAVGPSKDLSITVHKDTFDTLFILFIIIIGLIILSIIIVALYFAYQKSKLPPPPAPLLLPQDSSNFGGTRYSDDFVSKNMNDGSKLITENLCLAAQNTDWTDGKCKCKAPFFGDKCERERHNEQYFSVGNIVVPESNMIVSNKSFGEDSCSNYCDKTPKCHGFTYQNSQCNLLLDDIIIPEDTSISYSKEVDANLYLKSSDNLHFVNKVFLGEYIWTIPPRYWLVKDTPSYKQLTVGVVEKLSFIPTHIKMYGSHTGIYCSFPFTKDQVDILLKRGENSECVIHYPDGQLHFSPDWQDNIYVIYI